MAFPQMVHLGALVSPSISSNRWRYLAHNCSHWSIGACKRVRYVNMRRDDDLNLVLLIISIPVSHVLSIFMCLCNVKRICFYDLIWWLARLLTLERCFSCHFILPHLLLWFRWQGGLLEMVLWYYLFSGAHLPVAPPAVCDNINSLLQGDGELCLWCHECG